MVMPSLRDMTQRVGIYLVSFFMGPGQNRAVRETVVVGPRVQEKSGGGQFSEESNHLVLEPSTCRGRRSEDGRWPCTEFSVPQNSLLL